MSLPESFRENTRIFRGDENRIDRDSLENLIVNHGSEFAAGYLKCMQEITGILNKVLIVPGLDPKHPISETDRNTFNKIYNLHKALFDFLTNNNLDVDGLSKPLHHSSPCKTW